MSLEEEIIDYKENIEDILHWTTIKGEYRYCSIIEFLKSKGIECTWKNVTNYMRYDKRILVNSFKYIVLLEELFKAFIYKYKHVRRGELLRYGFSRAMEEYIELGFQASYDSIDVNYLQANEATIEDFRNSVVHNKILLNRTFKGKLDLEKALKVFCQALPDSYRAGFISDINKCSYNLVEDIWSVLLSKERI